MIPITYSQVIKKFLCITYTYIGKMMMKQMWQYIQDWRI